MINVTLDHKTSHKGQFYEFEIYTSIFGHDTAIWKSVIWGCKINLNIEKIAFKVVHMKYLAMHITNKKSLIYLR